jgi:hypothetical protein
VLPSLASAQFTVGVRSDFPAGVNPYSLALGDLNGDGFLDLVASNQNANTVSVLLGDGIGGFGAKTTFATGATPYGVSIGDLNGDGKADLVVVNATAFTVSVLLGDGAGGFGAKTDFATGAAPNNASIADVNGDGKPDLAVSCYTSNSVSVLLGNGSGGFAPRTDFTTGTHCVSVEIGDVSGDGKPDLVTANNGAASISVLLGDGTGGFGAKSDFTVGSAPRWLALGDVNGDGRLDLAVANSGANTVSVLLNNGSGGFGAKVDYATASDPRWVGIRDMNGDGGPDLVVANYAANSVSVLQGNGAGGFGAKTDFATGTNPEWGAIGDVNCDGRLDIALASYSANTVTVLLRSGFPLFAPRTDFGVGAPAWSVAIGDLNGDGIPDAAAATSASAVSVLPGDGFGGFVTRTDFTTANGPVSLALAPANAGGPSAPDLNSDGRADLVSANQAGNVSILIGNGLGSFLPKDDYGMGGGSCQSIAIADFNFDQKSDVVVANANNTVSVLLRSGAGFATGPVPAFPTGTTPVSVAVGQLNPQDPLFDVVTANRGANSVSVLLDNPPTFSPLFAPKVDYPTGTTPNAVAVGSLRLHPWGAPLLFYMDILTANDNGTVSVLLANSNESGGYAAKTDYPTAAHPLGLAVADLNGDGKPDVVTAGGSTASVLPGDNAGGLAAALNFTVASGAQSVAVADLNRDGVNDLVTANSTAGSISVLLGYVKPHLALAASSSAVLPGATLTLIATLPALPETPGLSPPKTVSFFDGLTPIGSASIAWTYSYGSPSRWGGTATIALIASRLGIRSYTATYDGEGLRMNSISSPVLVNVGTPASASFRSIRDVGGDQGKQVRITFSPNGYDVAGSGVPITQYEVYRQIDPLFAPRLAGAFRHVLRPASVQLAGWDYVGALAAHADTLYSIVVPTVVDSNITGPNLATFLLRAATVNPAVFYDSVPNSGYSVDNIPPTPPSPFTAAYLAGATYLHWGANSEPDLWYYKVYRGSSAGFTPGPGNQIATQSDTGFVDAGAAGHYYKLSAVDVNGNEGGYALLTPSGTLAVDLRLFAFALDRLPNPAVGGRLTVTFALPGNAHATLEIVDVSGRQVVQEDVGMLGAGRHVVTLGGDAPLSAGIYFVRLTQGKQSATQRVTVLE